MLFFNSNFPLGLDISDLSLKFIQLSKKGSKIKIQAAGKIDLPAGLIEGGVIKKRKETAEAIKKLIGSPKFGRVTTKEVSACLPESKTFLKLITVEKNANKLEDMVENEMEKHIPLSLKEIYYDWQIMEETNDRHLILIGAAPKDIVDEYTETLEEAKLSLSALEVEPVPICRSLLGEEKNKIANPQNNYGLIDIGATRTSLTIYSRETIAFTASLPLSGEKITEKIAGALKLDKRQAEKAKIICGLDEQKAEGIIKKILEETIEELAEKIKEAADFFGNHFPKRGPLKQIILCGGGANIKNIEQIIQEKTGIQTIRGNPLVNLNEKEEKIKKIFEEKTRLSLRLNGHGILNKEEITLTQNSALNFTTALGLALRGIIV